MHYLIGDLQGCDQAFARLLAEIGFSPSRDTLTLLGDLVARGPDSLAVLRRVMAMGEAAQCVLGNHDLNLLAVAAGVRKPRADDALGAVLAADDAPSILAWLRRRPLALQAQGWLCVHAGVAPAWDGQLTLALAQEVADALNASDHADVLRAMYGNEPARWSDALQGAERLRHAVNVLTRMRLCRADGTLDLQTSGGVDAAPPGFMPWFDVPGRRSAGSRIAFGHWSALGLVVRDDLLALDTGCVWGGQLSAARVDGGRREIIQVPCPQARQPDGG